MKLVGFVSFGTKEDIFELSNILIDYINKNKLLYVEINVEAEDDINWIQISDKNFISSDLIKICCMAATTYIINKYESRFLYRILNSNYCYFNANEKKDIYSLAKNMKNENFETFNISDNQTYEKIYNKLIEYFESSNKLFIDGFITFRLYEYLEELEQIVDKSVDMFLTDKEYREFIKLLKFFVSLQEPKISLIHILPQNGKYSLYNNLNSEITNECIKDYIKELSKGEINYDDLLMSTLITMAPKKVIIHNIDKIKNKELIRTIKNVFESSLEICDGCSLCSNNEKLQKDNIEYYLNN